MDKGRAKRVNRKRSTTQAIMNSKRKGNASENDMKEPSVKEYGPTQDDSMVTKEKATLEQIANLGFSEERRDEDAATTKITGDQQNPVSVKELRKRKRNADDEIAQAMLSSTNIKSSRLRPRKEVSSFQMVELNDNDSERIVGMRIKVYWPDSRKWFAGSIKSFNEKKSLHKINYDDGDVEELDLKIERFELEVKPNDGFETKTLLRSQKGKKDLGHAMVPKTSMSLECDEVKTNAEGETNKFAKSNEDGA